MTKLNNIIITLACIFLAQIAFSCTTFSFKNSDGVIVFGRNFDFLYGEGHIEINQRNLKKIAMLRPGNKPASWVSKYGSITFNQAGREFPYGGMNEAGLVIELMWLKETIYPTNDGRFAISETQWIQYQLDCCATIDEVIATNKKIRIENNAMTPLHFLIADSAGNVATVEFLQGKMVVHKGNDLPYQTLANCPYQTSVEYMNTKKKKRKETFNEWTNNSSGRFATATEMIEDYQKKDNIIDYSFEILDSVAQKGSTQWSIVYDITNKNIYYKTKINSQIQKLEMDNFNFSCNSKRLYTPIIATTNGAAGFKEYNFQDNYNLIKATIENIDFLKEKVPQESLIYSAKYPESAVCKNE